MGKELKTIYTCDRCGKTIDVTPFTIDRHRYLHVFRWYIPIPICNFALKYICPDCFDSFKKWYRGDKNADQ